MKTKTFVLASLPAVPANPSLALRLSASRITPRRAASVAALLLCHASLTHAETWNLPAGGTWNAAASWNPASIPNGIGANATLNNAASGSNPAQTGNRPVTLDGPQTVGSINFNNDAANTFTMSLTTGTGGALTLDETGPGPATITVPAGPGTGNNTISVATTLTDSLVATVNQITASSAAGALNLTAAISGPGGFTKMGDGLATFGTGAKTYTGPTVLGGGRLRMSLAAAATATSSFTINVGGQLDLISAGSFTLGAGPLNLNGAGPTTGPFAPFPGAIRPDTGIAVVINNAVVLESDSLLHVQGSAAGSMTLPAVVSGPGKLTFTSTPHDANLGMLVLNGANSYGGGTIVDGGTLVVSGASASLGTGNVTVNSANAAFGGASAKLRILTGVLNAIADSATLSLAGGNVAATADDGFVELQTGVNEVVSSLVLGGVTQGPGTYGSTASTATTQNDEYFAGPGMVTVPPVLTITFAAGNVMISWPTSATVFTLQELSAFPPGLPPYPWTDVGAPVSSSGGFETVTLPAVGPSKYLRLR